MRAMQSLPVMLVAGLFACDSTKGDVSTGPPVLDDTGINSDSDADADADSGTDTAPPDPTGASLEFTLGVVHEGAPALGGFPGIVGVPNLDDDDENGDYGVRMMRMIMRRVRKQR